MRSEQVTKNLVAGTIGQLATVILGFITRTIFINTLSAQYLGISGLFSSVLTVLNISELGIGASITYALYKPLSDNDEKKIASIMCFYKNAYRIIGLVVMMVGLIMLPFLNNLVSNEASSLVNIYIVFALYVFESVTTYWIRAYKCTLFEADQKKYYITFYNTICSICILIIRITLLLLMHDSQALSFYVYLIIGSIGQIIQNLIVAKKADKLYGYINDKCERLTQDEKKPIFKNIAGMITSKVSGVMLTSVDNILISAFINTTTVGIYSNYIALRSYIIKPIGLIFDSMTASIGNYCTSESITKKLRFFGTLSLAYFWIYGFCGICFWILLNPFIEGIWIGHEYVLSNRAVFLIVLNFVLDGLSGAVIKFRDVHGLYWESKYRYIFSAVFNGLISYILIKPLGIEGVLLGSTMSIVIMISFDPIIVFRNVFHVSSKQYYLKYAGYLVLIISTAAVVSLIVSPFHELSLLNFIIKVIVCCVVPNALWVFIFRKNQNYFDLKEYVVVIIRNMKIRIRKKS